MTTTYKLRKEIVKTEQDLIDLSQISSMFWHEASSPCKDIEGFAELASEDNFIKKNQRESFEDILQSAQKIAGGVDLCCQIEESLLNDFRDKEFSSTRYKTRLEEKKAYLAETLKQVEDLRETSLGEVKEKIKCLGSKIKDLGKQDLPEEPREYLGIIESRYNCIEELGRLCDLGSLSGEEILKHSSEINLKEISKEALAQFQKEFQEFGINLKVRYQGNLNIHAPPQLIYTILTTLGGNGANHVPRDSTFGWDFDGTNGNIRIKTKNRYSPYSRNLHGTHKGLGIPFVKKVIRNMGGEMTTSQDTESYYTNIRLQKHL